MMQVQTNNRTTTTKTSLIQMIHSYPDLSDYFSKNCPPNKEQELVVSLLRSSISQQKSHQKHYHTAYIKQRPFLSPSQRQAVSPKVTEVVPVSPHPPRIFGKPKVKLSEQFLNNEEEASARQERSPMQTIEDNKQNNRLEPQGVKSSKPKEQQMESEGYLSPCKELRVQSKQQIQSPTNKDQKKTNSKPVASQPVYNKPTSPSSVPHKPQNDAFKTTTKTKHPMAGSKSSRVQHYEQVESRIKFLIDRDKKNKQLERQLEEQNRQLDQLQARQARLLKRQEIQELALECSHEPEERGCCCCTSDEELTSQLLATRSKVTTEHYNSHYNSSFSRLHMPLSPPLKSYKINSHAVYPISSSSDSDLSSEEIVVTAKY